MVANIDPAGDAILHSSVLSLLDPLREAVAADSPFPWRSHCNNRFAIMYFRVTERNICTKTMHVARQVKSIDLVSITVSDLYQNRGVFKAVLAELKSIAKSSGRVLYLENVINPRVLHKLKQDPDFKLLRQYGGISAPCFVHIPK